MSLIEQLAATGESVEVGGEEYYLTPLTVADWAKVEQEILRQRPDPITVALRVAEGLPPDDRKELLSQAYSDGKKASRVSAEELDAFRESLQGRVFETWLSLRHSRPDITRQEADAFLQLMTADFYKEAFAELKRQFPDLTWEQLIATAKAKETGAVLEMVNRLEAMPAGNLEAPEEPGQRNGQSTGRGFFGFLRRNTIGRLKRSAR